jgi:hypothetical protein
VKGRDEGLRRRSGPCPGVILTGKAPSSASFCCGQAVRKRQEQSCPGIAVAVSFSGPFSSSVWRHLYPDPGRPRSDATVSDHLSFRAKGRACGNQSPNWPDGDVRWWVSSAAVCVRTGRGEFLVTGRAKRTAAHLGVLVGGRRGPAVCPRRRHGESREDLRRRRAGPGDGRTGGAAVAESWRGNPLKPC